MTSTKNEIHSFTDEWCLRANGERDEDHVQITFNTRNYNRSAVIHSLVLLLGRF